MKQGLCCGAHCVHTHDMMVLICRSHVTAGAACIVCCQESYGIRRTSGRTTQQVLTSATHAGRGGSRTRGTYMGHAGEKRPRNLERLTAAGAQSAVDMSLEHEYSD